MSKPDPIEDALKVFGENVRKLSANWIVHRRKYEKKKFLAILLILFIFAFPLFSYAASKIIVSVDFNTKDKDDFVEDAYKIDEAKFTGGKRGKDGSEAVLSWECTTENDAR